MPRICAGTTAAPGALLGGPATGRHSRPAPGTPQRDDARVQRQGGAMLGPRRGDGALSSPRATPRGVLTGTGRLLRPPTGAGSVQPQGDAARGADGTGRLLRHRQGRALVQPQGDAARVLTGTGTGPLPASRQRHGHGVQLGGRERSARPASGSTTVPGVRSDALGIGSARPGRALGSGGDRGSVRRPGDRASAARTSRERLDRHRYDCHARQATRTKRPPEARPMLVAVRVAIAP